MVGQDSLNRTVSDGKSQTHAARSAPASASRYQLPAEESVDIGMRDRMDGFERPRGAQHQRIGVARADDLQADGQSLLREAAGHARGRLLREVEGISEGRPVGPALLLED